MTKIQTRAKDILKEIHEKNSKIREAVNEGMPEVAAFWWMGNNKLIGKSTPWISAYSDPERRYYSEYETHYNYWRTLKGIGYDFGNLEFDQVPRGRIIYDKELDIFFVYTKKSLLKNDKFKKKVIQEYSLPLDKTKFKFSKEYEIFPGD